VATKSACTAPTELTDASEGGGLPGILGIGLVFVDFKFGDGRLVQSVSTQTIDLGYRLNDSFSRIVRRIAP
jgi:hypothetical protein